GRFRWPHLRQHAVVRQALDAVAPAQPVDLKLAGLAVDFEAEEVLPLRATCVQPADLPADVVRADEAVVLDWHVPKKRTCDAASESLIVDTTIASRSSRATSSCQFSAGTHPGYCFARCAARSGPASATATSECPSAARDFARLPPISPQPTMPTRISSTPRGL